MAHSFWSFPGIILLVWATQRIRNVPDVVRRPPVEPPFSLDNLLDWLLAALRVFLLGKRTPQVCMEMLKPTRVVLWEGCMTNMGRGCS